MWCWKDERGFGTSLVPLLCTWPGPKVRTNRLWMCLSVCAAYVEEALHSFIKVIANQLIEKKKILPSMVISLIRFGEKQKENTQTELSLKFKVWGISKQGAQWCSRWNKR